MSKLFRKIFRKESAKIEVTIARSRTNNSQKGWAFEDGKIQIPSINDLQSLQTSLHELMHIYLEHTLDKEKALKEEWEAETAALRLLRKYKLNKGEYRADYLKVLNNAKLYVGTYINYTNMNNVPIRIKRWYGKKFLHMVYKKIRTEERWLDFKIALNAIKDTNREEEIAHIKLRISDYVRGRDSFNEL
jgi:hypothetical protein